MQYYLLLTILKNNRSYREEALSRYEHLGKRDSTDTSVGRAEDCSPICNFASNLYLAGSDPAKWIPCCFLLTILKKYQIL